MRVTTAVRRTVWAAGLVVAAAAVAQAQAPPAAPKVVQDTVRTADNWILPVTYFKSGAGREAPAVILLHGTGGSRLVFGTERAGLAKILQDRGYAVLTVDLRKHGEAQPPAGARGPAGVTANDYQAMLALDLEALKGYLLERHHAGELNVRKTAIVAAGDMAPVAANFAVADWLKPRYPDAADERLKTPRGEDIRALVLLSPAESAGRVSMGRALNALKSPLWKVSTLVIVGAEDREDGNTARKVYDRLTTPDTKDRVFLERFEQVKDRGTDLLGGRTQAEAKIVIFLEKFLKELPDPWANRKSRL